MNTKRLRVASAIAALVLAHAFEHSPATAETAPEAAPVSPPASSVATPAAPPSVSVPTSLEDKLIVPWNDMNVQFREQYVKARLRKIEKLGPVVILKDDKMMLKYKGNAESVMVIPQRYTLLKSVSHITLTIFVILEGKTGVQLDADTRQSLSGFREFIDKAAANIGEWKLSADSLSRQKQIIEDSRTFIDTTLKNGTVSSDELTSYTRAMAPLVLENAYDGIALELDLIDSSLKTWKEKIPAEDWKRIRIAVMQPHMPRNQNSIMQYFGKMLKQPYEGESIIYGEGGVDEEYAINLIGTHILDKRIAVDFFKDPWRMHRDLLSDGAKRYLKKHRPLK